MRAAMCPLQLRAALRRCGAAAVRAAPPRRALPPRAAPRTFAAAADGAQTPPPPDIPKLAAMARLDVTDAQAAAWSPKINAIVDWFGQLRGVELGGVEPSLRAPTADGGGADASASAATLHTRADVAVDFAAREDMLASAPKRQPPFIYIPRIATTDDSA